MLLLNYSPLPFHNGRLLWSVLSLILLARRLCDFPASTAGNPISWDGILINFPVFECLPLTYAERHVTKSATT